MEPHPEDRPIYLQPFYGAAGGLTDNCLPALAVMGSLRETENRLGRLGTEKRLLSRKSALEAQELDSEGTESPSEEENTIRRYRATRKNRDGRHERYHDSGGMVSPPMIMIPTRMFREGATAEIAARATDVCYGEKTPICGATVALTSRCSLDYVRKPLRSTRSSASSSKPTQKCFTSVCERTLPMRDFVYLLGISPDSFKAPIWRKRCTATTHGIKRDAAEPCSRRLNSLFVEGLLPAASAQVRNYLATHPAADYQAVSRYAQAIGETHRSARSQTTPYTSPQIPPESARIFARTARTKLVLSVDFLSNLPTTGGTETEDILAVCGALGGTVGYPLVERRRSGACAWCFERSYVG